MYKKKSRAARAGAATARKGGAAGGDRGGVK